MTHMCKKYMICLAVTGLVFAVVSKHTDEFPANRRFLAGKLSSPIVFFKSIGGTCSVPASLFIKVVNAGWPDNLERTVVGHFSWSQAVLCAGLWNRGMSQINSNTFDWDKRYCAGRSRHIDHHLLSSIEREHFHLWGHVSFAGFICNRRTFIKKWNPQLGIGNWLEHGSINKGIRAISSLRVLDPDMHLSGPVIKSSRLDVAGELPYQNGIAREIQARSVFLAEVPFFHFGMKVGLNVCHNVRNQHAKRDESTDHFCNPNELLLAIGRAPMSYKSPLLALLGLSATVLGLLGFFICLDVDATWGQFVGSILLVLMGAAIILGVVINLIGSRVVSHALTSDVPSILLQL
jgi:hypothetical protein